MKTAIVILNWNGKGFLERFLPCLLDSAQTVPDTEVIVADNASTDGSMEMLAEKFPAIKTIVFDKNYGFTGGYNRALKQIDAQYFIIMNSDIEVGDGWLAPIVEWMDSHPLCAACAPKILSWKQREMFEYAGAAGGCIDRYGYPFCRGRVMGMIEKDFGQYNEPEDVFWVSGACIAVKSELFRRAGGFDERFFAHMEEIDLCWKLQLMGYDITVVPESTVYHIGGGTLPNDSPRKLFLNYRNNLLMLGSNLAKTFALLLFNDNEDEDEAVRKGINMARKRLRMRLFLDKISALVYLFEFKTECFKAVLRAHKEYKKLVSSPKEDEIKRYIRHFGKIAGINGMYDRWIVPLAIFKGKRASGIIRQELFSGR